MENSINISGSRNDLLKTLELPPLLRQRILRRTDSDVTTPTQDDNNIACKPVVVYFPTVVLRKRHNPGFALACRIANYYQIPLLVICTVLDDHHLSKKPLQPICMTARRLAFTLEALQSCAQEWQAHGAGVFIRVHGPGARSPHHLSLVYKAARAVVCDEPFVEPFRNFVQRIVNAANASDTPCFTVDGSTTVPPASKLRRLPCVDSKEEIRFAGVPSKAWMWEKQTDSVRTQHINGAVNEGILDAPDLGIKLPPDFLFDHGQHWKFISDVLPPQWKDTNATAPGVCPWTVQELADIVNIHEWTMTQWKGTDTSVTPMKQTCGSKSSAQERWNYFLNSALPKYAQLRNQIVYPHAVSRMSCYLNLGILSIFDIVNDVYQAQRSRPGYSAGCTKFLEEVVKWREMGYAHALSTPHYRSVESLPNWSKQFLTKQDSNATGYTFEELASADTGDETWNAMQAYLNETGELHNNARMTWGKTVVHWLAGHDQPDDVLWKLICLNDRFALDGLSPPSYAGILWCFGWCDKPGANGTITAKPAHRYRTGPDGFELAKERLYEQPPAISSKTTTKKVVASTSGSATPSSRKKQKLSSTTSPSIRSFFGPKQKIK